MMLLVWSILIFNTLVIIIARIANLATMLVATKGKPPFKTKWLPPDRTKVASNVMENTKNDAAGMPKHPPTVPFVHPHHLSSFSSSTSFTPIKHDDCHMSNRCGSNSSLFPKTIVVIIMITGTPRMMLLVWLSSIQQSTFFHPCLYKYN